MVIDRVTLEILRNHYQAVVEDMARIMERTAYATFVKETADFSTGLVSTGGEYVAYPWNLGASSYLGLNMAHTLAYFDHYDEGDIIICNDAYLSGPLCTHLPDVHILRPIFHDGRIICWGYAFVHSSDIGGAVPASVWPRATEIFQEGLRLRPTKLFRAGILQEDVKNLIADNCRIPEVNWGDIKAMVAAVSSCDRRVQEMIGKFGLVTVVEAIDAYIVTEDPGIPKASSILRPVRVTAPPGCLVNALFPSPIGVRYGTVLRVFDAVLGALAQALPGHIPAAPAGGISPVVASTLDLLTGQRHVQVVEPMLGGGGGRPEMDGISGADSTAGFLRNTPVESIEAEVPIVMRRYHLISDTGGAGEYRGGLAVRLDFQVFHPHAIVTARGMERCRLEPWGVAGGRAGTSGSCVVNRGTAGARDIGKVDVLHPVPGGAFDFGESRAVMERLWSPAIQDAAHRVLGSVPPAVRDWGKHQIYERIREIAGTRPPTTADVDAAWGDIRSRLARALGES